MSGLVACSLVERRCGGELTGAVGQWPEGGGLGVRDFVVGAWLFGTFGRSQANTPRVEDFVVCSLVVTRRARRGVERRCGGELAGTVGQWPEGGGLGVWDVVVGVWLLGTFGRSASEHATGEGFCGVLACGDTPSSSRDKPSPTASHR